MSARSVIEHALTAYYEDSGQEQANLTVRVLLANYDAAHRAGVLSEGAVLVEHAACDADFTEDPKFIAGLRTAAELLTRAAGEKATPLGATATPEPTGRVAQLLDAIRTHRGVWTTARAYRFYRDHARSLDDMPQGHVRTVARGDLRDLAAWGHLVVSEESGRREYTLKTRKDGRS